MCGIVGYTGGGNAAEVIYGGLLQLEYRGYDSAGLSVLDNGKINTVKLQGRVGKLQLRLHNLCGNTGIGHTRWATHGRPSDINAHPHTSGKITLVHNGIIENYAELKAALSSDGATFLSDTDSEVVASLIDKNYSGDLLEALFKSVKLLKGSYALMVMCEDFDGFAVAKMKSPVILGFGESENFCASDEPALAGKCPEICVLSDGDFALVSKNSVEIYDGGLNRITRPVLKNTASPAQYDLGGYAHYMIKEIREAPAAVKNTVSAFYEVTDGIKKALSGVKKVIFVGCGTAYHAALVGKRYVEEFARIDASAEYAGEFRYKNPVIDEHTAVIAVTQSGETADTVEAARLAFSLGAKVIAVTNCPHSAITREASITLPVAAGPEICVAATKSYSGQIAALYLLALCIAEGREAGERAQKLSKIYPLLREVSNNADVCKLAEMCAHSNGVYFLGRDIDYAVALEGSLKLKEVSYLTGGGYPAGELKHGTLALIDGQTVSVFVICDESLADKSAAAVEQVLSRGGKAAVVTNIRSIEESFLGRAEIIALPQCDKYLSPLLSSSVLQLLAYRTAVLMGRDPDKPRNLAKSVTVE